MDICVIAVGFLAFFAAASGRASGRGLILHPCISYPRYVTPHDAVACTCSHTMAATTSGGPARKWTLLWEDPRSRPVVNVTWAGKDKAVDVALKAAMIKVKDNAAIFKCLLLSNGTVVASRDYLPFLIFGPKNVSLTSTSAYAPTDGGNMTLTVTALSSPVLAFTWRGHLPGAVVGPGNTFGPGLFSQSLTFDPSAYDDSHVIECSVNNSKWPSPAVTVSHRLRFERKAELSSSCIQSPRFITPKDAIACTCTFTPPVTSPPQSWKVRWLNSRGHQVSRHISQHGKPVTLHLCRERIERNESGRPFTCVVINTAEKRQKYFSRVDFVPSLAYGPESISLSSSHPFLPKDGSKVTLTCCAKVIPEPIFKWKGQPEGATILPEYACSEGRYCEKLTLDVARYTEGSLIECFVDNTEFLASQSANLTIFFDTSSESPAFGLLTTTLIGSLVMLVLKDVVVFAVFCYKKFHRRPSCDEQESLVTADSLSYQSMNTDSNLDVFNWSTESSASQRKTCGPSGISHLTTSSQFSSTHPKEYAQSSVTHPKTYAQTSVTHPKTYAQTSVTHPKTYTQTSVTHPKTYAQSSVTHPKTYAQTSVTHPKTDAQTSVTHPKTYAQTSVTHPKTYAQTSVTHPKTDAQTSVTHPKTDAQTSVTHPKTYAQTSVTHPKTYAQTSVTHPKTYAQSSVTHPTEYAQTSVIHSKEYAHSGVTHPRSYAQFSGASHTGTGTTWRHSHTDTRPLSHSKQTAV